ncbi:hypothetical protein FGO68_gene6945 [Halteria grandinella]|uniref:Uncharacterized protein n=1 Tax=Halteria grandinella TaxID=5974 RepID=A0A8J8T211_HALGN|nr:hypothetical protein FGO68_gene6945 [Halteria grandinella]
MIIRVHSRGNIQTEVENTPYVKKGLSLTSSMSRPKSATQQGSVVKKRLQKYYDEFTPIKVKREFFPVPQIYLNQTIDAEKGLQLSDMTSNIGTEQSYPHMPLSQKILRPISSRNEEKQGGFVRIKNLLQQSQTFQDGTISPHQPLKSSHPPITKIQISVNQAQPSDDSSSHPQATPVQTLQILTNLYHSSNRSPKRSVSTVSRNSVVTICRKSPDHQNHNNTDLEIVDYERQRPARRLNLIYSKRNIV